MVGKKDLVEVIDGNAWLFSSNLERNGKKGYYVVGVNHSLNSLLCIILQSLDRLITKTFLEIYNKFL